MDSHSKKAYLEDRAPRKVGKWLHSLKLTASSHLEIDGWNIFSFPFGFRPIFRGEVLVSGRVITMVIVFVP